MTVPARTVPTTRVPARTGPARTGPARTGSPASRLLTRSVAAGAALLAVVLGAAPALAAGPGGSTGPGGSLGGGGGTGCSGVSCYADVWQYIRLSGDAASDAGGNGVPVQMPPPPCYMEPMFSGPQLYALWKAGSQLPGDPEFPFQPWVPQIRQHKDSNAGYWWERVTNLQIGGTCGLPLLAWVVNGAPPPLPAVPEVDLAVYAYDHMTLPNPGLTFNPVARSYVSLPTYVWAALPWKPPLGTVTATLGGESATVTATPGRLALGAGDSAQIYDSDCTTLGSTAPNPPQDAGPGTAPDCGVTFTAPGYDDSITGSIRWVVTSNYRDFPAITTTTTDPVTVFEIQSLDNN
jgi:hypothetical protein